VPDPAVLVLAELGESHEAPHEEATPPTAATETTATETAATDTTTRAAEPTEGTATQPPERVFVTVASPSCSGCHTLSDAGASGSMDQSDATKPSTETVVDRVTNGLGVMIVQRL
jgi:mono/diheme cytochrome c family protein